MDCTRGSTEREVAHLEALNPGSKCAYVHGQLTWSGPEGSRKLRFPDLMTTAQDGGCQPYALTAFTPRKYTWYSFLLEAESTPGP